MAVMPTRGDNGHSHELDYAFKAVGYELTNMVEAVEQMDWFERRIDDFDLVYCPPLSAFVRNEENSMRWAPVPFDLRKHAPTIARWIQAGGVLTMVDVNDPDMLAWLDAMDPKMAATTESCSFPPAVLMEPTGPVLFLPRRAEFGCEWGDLSSETNVLLRGVSVCDGASDGETPPPRIRRRCLRWHAGRMHGFRKLRRIWRRSGVYDAHRLLGRSQCGGEERWRRGERGNRRPRRLTKVDIGMFDSGKRYGFHFEVARAKLQIRWGIVRVPGMGRSAI